MSDDQNSIDLHGDAIYRLKRLVHDHGGETIDANGGVIPRSFTEANLPPSPATGANFWSITRNTPIYFDGSEYHVPVVGNDVKTSSTSVDNTTTETTVHTANFVADSLVADRMYEVKLLGVFSTDSSSDFFTYKAKIGGTTIADIDSVAGNVTDGGISITVTFTVRSAGASGSIMSHTESTFNDNSVTDHNGTSTVDTTAANTLDSTIQWDSAAAGNTLTIGQARLLELS